MPPYNSPSRAPPNVDSQQNPVVEWFYAWCERTPVVTRNTLVIIVVMYLFSCFGAIDTLSFAVVPMFVMQLGLHRLFLAPFAQNSLFGLLFVCLSFSGMGQRLEQMRGSSSLLSLMLMLAVLGNTAFVVVCCLLSFADPRVMFSMSSGFWNVIMSLIVVECHYAPDTNRRMMFLPCEIPSKYFPLALLGFFSLLGGNLFPLFVSVGVGYAYCNGYCASFEPSAETLALWEANGRLTWLVNKPGFVPLTTEASGPPAGAANMALLPSSQPGSSGGGGMFGAGPAAPSSFGGGAARDSQPQAFSGSGHALGGSAGGGSSGGGAGSAWVSGYGAGAGAGGAASAGGGAGGGEAAQAAAVRAARAAQSRFAQHQSGEVGNTMAALPPLRGDTAAYPHVGEYHVELSQLNAMGFTDRAACLRALQNAGGNVDAAAAILLPPG